MKKSNLLGLAISALIVAAAGAASAKDKYVECIDPDIGKSCMECNQGGTQVCCPKEGTCTVNKGGLIGDPISLPTACSEPDSQQPIDPTSEGGEQQS
jgi:hypothetical protein